MNDFLLQQVLGDDWYRLPRTTQRHYEVQEGRGSCLEGTMTISYPHFMLPMIGLIHLCGGLVFRRGVAIRTHVEKSVKPGDKRLYWQRTLSYPDGKAGHFCSRMEMLGDHELLEMIGCGFGIRLVVQAQNDGLVYRSKGHIWQCGAVRLTIPDWLLLGHAHISEHVLAEDQFHLDFTIRHPLWGETYSYRGDFHYC